MAKTKPIGVRFDEELMNEIGGTAQNVLITLESFYKTTKLLSKEPLLKFHKPTPKSYDAPKMHNIILDEVGKWEYPKPLTEFELTTLKERKIQLEYEIANPGNPLIGKKVYTALRETELKDVELKLMFHEKEN